MKKICLFLSIIFILFILCSCSNHKTPEQSTQNTTESKKEEVITTIKPIKETTSIIIKIKDKSFKAQLYDNETAKAFAEMLPLTLDMNELHGNEKYYYFNNSLPTNTSDIGKINNGDIMLYGSDCLVLFYDSFATNYSYTKIGYIENPTDIADAVGNGNITITFEK